MDHFPSTPTVRASGRRCIDLTIVSRHNDDGDAADASTLQRGMCGGRCCEIGSARWSPSVLRGASDSATSNGFGIRIFMFANTFDSLGRADVSIKIHIQARARAHSSSTHTSRLHSSVSRTCLMATSSTVWTTTTSTRLLLNTVGIFYMFAACGATKESLSLWYYTRQTHTHAHTLDDPIIFFIAITITAYTQSHSSRVNPIFASFVSAEAKTRRRRRNARHRRIDVALDYIYNRDD